MRDDPEYREIVDWAAIGDSLGFREIADAAIDADGTVYVLGRGEPGGVVRLTRGGEVIDRWGGEYFSRPHGLTLCPGEDALWVTDDFAQSVRKFSRNGELLQTIGSVVPVDYTGYVRGDTDSIRRPGPPFCFPTAVDLAGSGELMVSDGYGNARVHRFSPDGSLLESWGAPGREPGQFRLPHGILVDGERLLVADRENNRVQVFGADGVFREQWDDCRRPAAVQRVRPGLYAVAELGWVNQARGRDRYMDPTAPSGRITLRDAGGRLLREFTPSGMGRDETWFAPHGLAVGPDGEIVVTETWVTFFRGQAPPRPALHRFEPVPSTEETDP